MINRIKKILEEYKLSPTIFSEKLGIQKANVSHVLNGRNKPSLDFVLKVSEAFPEINIEWILKGKGSMKVENMNTSSYSSPTLFPTQNNEVKQPPIVKEITHKETSRKTASKEQGSTKKNIKNNSKEMKKVILLYDDNTFDYFDKNSEE